MGDPSDGFDLVATYNDPEYNYDIAAVHGNGLWAFNGSWKSPAGIYAGTSFTGPFTFRSAMPSDTDTIKWAGGYWWAFPAGSPTGLSLYWSDDGMDTWNAVSVANLAADDYPNAYTRFARAPYFTDGRYWVIAKHFDYSGYDFAIYSASATTPGGTWTVGSRIDADYSATALGPNAGVTALGPAVLASGDNAGSPWCLYVVGVDVYNEEPARIDSYADTVFATASTPNGSWTSTVLRRVHTFPSSSTEIDLFPAAGSSLFGQSGEWWSGGYRATGTVPDGPWTALSGSLPNAVTHGDGSWVFYGTDDDSKPLVYAGNSLASLTRVHYDITDAVGSVSLYYMGDGEWYSYCYAATETYLPDYYLQPSESAGWGIALA